MALPPTDIVIVFSLFQLAGERLLREKKKKQNMSGARRATYPLTKAQLARQSQHAPARSCRFDSPWFKQIKRLVLFFFFLLLLNK